jgi:hypothetical protein
MMITRAVRAKRSRLSEAVIDAAEHWVSVWDSNGKAEAKLVDAVQALNAHKRKFGWIRVEVD